MRSHWRLIVLAGAAAVSAGLAAIFVAQGGAGCHAGDGIGPRTDARAERSVRDIFGVDVFLSPTEWRRAKDTLLSGRTMWTEPRPDGAPRVALFLQRDGSRRAPMLVKVVGAVADPRAPRGIAADQGVWLVDYGADCTIDRVVAYEHDVDAAIHRTVHYYSSWINAPVYALPAVIATVRTGAARPVLALTDYEYVQGTDQWRSDFNGAIELAMFYWDPRERALVPVLEAPFCFYDEAGSGVSEVTVKFDLPVALTLAGRIHSRAWRAFGLAFSPGPLDGMTETIRLMRYSLALRVGRTPDRPYGYLFSVSAVGEVDPGRWQAVGWRIGRLTTRPVLTCATARQVAVQAPWRATSLTWVEDGLNEAETESRGHGRWEGVINRGSAEFPQVGGPPVRVLNTRTELNLAPRGPIRLYYSDVDKRIHLLGATKGWLALDLDGNGRPDVQIRYRDRNGNGVIDTWEIGTAAGDDRTITVEDERATSLDLDVHALRPFYWERARKTNEQRARLITLARNILGARDGSRSERLLARAGRADSPQDPARAFYLGAALDEYLGELTRWLAGRGEPAAAGEIRRLADSGRYEDLERVLAGLNGRRR